MAALNGKWKVVSTDNAEAFFKSLGYADDVIKKAAPVADTANENIDEINITDTNVCIVHTLNGNEVSRHDMVLNKEFEFTSHGVKSKLLLTLEGDALKTVQKNDGGSATYIRTVKGDTMTQEMKSDKVTSIRKLKKIT